MHFCEHLTRYSFLSDRTTAYSSMFSIAKKDMLNLRIFLLRNTLSSSILIASGTETIVITLSLMWHDVFTTASHMLVVIFYNRYTFALDCTLNSFGLANVKLSNSYPISVDVTSTFTGYFEGSRSKLCRVTYNRTLLLLLILIGGKSTFNM